MSHYYDASPAGPIRKTKITAELRGRTITFYSANGIFSAKHVDNATRLLIEECQISEGHSILDLGCGYGIVGIALKTAFPGCSVVCTDINSRAVRITRENTRMLGLDVDVRQGEIYEPVNDERFDTICTNPPYVAGRETCFAFIQGARDHLVPGGALQLVARHNKGGKVLSMKMQDVFGNVETLAKRGGFRVYRSRL